jgi:hypothetical protein
MDRNLPKSPGAKKNPYTATTGELILDKIQRERAAKQNTTKGTKDRWKNKRRKGDSDKNRQVRI